MTIGRKLLFTLPLLLLSSAFGAQVPPPLIEKVEVRVVNVDVTVTDRDGRPVTGLSADEFELFESGARQEITGFYEIRDAAVKAAEEGDFRELTPDDRFRRRMVLIFDNNSISRADRDKAIDYVKSFIDNEFSEDYEWSVVAAGGPTMRTLQNFTNDKEAIRSALLEVREMPTFDFQRDVDRAILSDPGRKKLSEGKQTGSDYDFAETARFVGREQTMRNVLSTRRTGDAIIQTCRAYTASPGKKVMLLLTGGIDLNTVFTAFENNHDPKQADLRLELEQMFDAIVREANAANFNIYVVKANGLETLAPQHDVKHRSAGIGGTMKNPFFGEGFDAVSDVRDLDSASLTLALGTGGRYLPGNSVSQSLERVDDASSNFYSLGYRPGQPEDGRYYEIEVRLKRPGLVVSHREGYLALSEHQRIERSLRSPLTFAKEKGSLPVTISLAQPVERNGKRLIPVIASIPADRITFLPAERASRGRVHVYIAVYDEKGENTGLHYSTKDLNVPNAQAGQIGSTPFRYRAEIPLEAGSYTIVVTLRDELSDQFGSAFQDLRI